MKNTDQAKASVHTSVGNGWRMAGTFTTGSNSAGYTLESVGIYVSAWNGNVGNFTASIWSTTSSGAPDSSLYTLTNPTLSSGDAVNTFTVSNATLDASTTYAVVMAVSNGTVAVWMTTSDDEDGGAASGWSIGDTRFQSNNQGSWQTDSSSRTPMFEITGTLGSSSNNAPTVANEIPNQTATAGTAFSHTFPANTFNDADGDTLTYTATKADGTALPSWLTFTASSRTFSGTPAAADVGTLSVKVTASDGTASVSDTFDIVVSAASTGALVSNTGRTDGGDASLANDHAQAFTTGTNGTGYRLTGVDLELELTSGTAPTYTVKVFRSVDLAGSMRPLSEVGELTQQGTLPSTAGLVRFAHADGLELVAETTYFVVLDVTAGATGNAKAGRTSGKSEDPGAAAGWSIADERLFRGATSTTWSTETANVLKLALHGEALAAGPAVTIAPGTSPVTEGTAAAFTLTASPAPSAELVVAVTVSEAGGGDHVASGDEGGKRVVFAAGATTRTFSVPTQADTTGEPDGTVTVAIGKGIGYTVGATASAEVTVEDDDGTAPAAPAAPTVATGGSTVLQVSWSAPSDLGSATAITDYDLRYFAGTADPTDPADWIEEGETAGPPDPGTNTSARITGLTESTAYRVQVRAMGDLESPWSSSGSGTPTNRAPRLLELISPLPSVGENRCQVKSDLATPAAEVNSPEGGLVSLQFTERLAGETEEFPATCFSNITSSLNPFDDLDGDALTFTFVESSRPDNVVSVEGTPTLNANIGRLFHKGAAAFQETNLDLSVTGTDPGGLAVTGVFRYVVGTFDGSSAPTFGSSTVAAQTYTANQAIAELQLPAATGGDLYVTDHDGDSMTPDQAMFSYGYEVTGLPDGLSFDPVTRKITGTPTTAGGPHTVTYTAEDADSKCADAKCANNVDTDRASLTFAITVSASSNNAPTVANEIPDQSITALAAFSYQFPANTFNDADGDTLTYTATKADGTALPVWLSFNAGTRTFSGTVPAAGSHGDSASIKVTASDGTDSVSDTFDIVVNEVPTVANQISDQTATAGTAFSFTFPANTFNDADASDTLTYTATKADGTALPSWLTFTASSRTFSGTPAAADVGTLSVKVTATDDTASASVSDTFDIVVSAAPSTSPAANTLVSNIDLTAGNIISFTSDIAQRFTTGANTSGYKLTRVDIGINGGSTAPGYTVTIREGNAAAPSGTIAGTLTKPTLQSGQQNAQFTSSDGIDLKPNTPYWVMLDVSSPGSGHSALTTSSNNQTGEAGWAIMDTSRWRTHDSTGGWTTNNHAVRIKVLGSAIPAALSSATADGTTLTLHFNGALDRTATAPAASAFTVTAAGTDQTPTGLAVGVSTVTLTLGTAVTAGQTVTVTYAKPAMNPLQDANGNEVAGFTGESVTNNTGAAAVSGVAISSTPSNDADNDGTADTYGLGEKIRVQLTFGSAVTVDTSGGTPRLKIKLVQDKWANYESGSGTKVLTFAYTVVDGNASSGGTAVLADTLELNGGTITSGGSNADLAHGGLVHDLAHKVDASLMTDNAPPTFQRAEVKGTTLAVTFDEALDTSSAPAGSVFTLSDGKAGTGTVAISGRTATVTLDSAVTAGAVVTLTYTKPGTNPLRDAAGNEVAGFIGQAVTNNTGVPAVTGVAISSTPSHDTDSDNTPDTYGLDEKIRVQLTFDEAVTVDTTGGTPRLKIKLVQDKWANYESGSGTTVLTFAYTVLAGNLSSDGIEVLADTLELNSGTIRDADGNNALLTHAAVARDANHKVNGGLSDSTAPTFQSAAVNGTTLTVTFNENLDTGSAPAGSAFTTSGSRTGTGTVSISGATATVTLDSAATHGETVTVSYTKPTSNPLQDASGNDVATFTGQAVTNNTPSTPATGALVSNTGQTTGVTGVRLTVDFAQKFTTGSRSGGYTVTRVDIRMQSGSGTVPDYTVRIQSDSSSAPDGTDLGTLTQQGSLPATAGPVLFTNSSGIHLATNTDYWLVFDLASLPDTNHQNVMFSTSSDSEDSDEAAGWSIADDFLWRGRQSGTWQGATTNTSTLQIAIYGSANNNAPTVANEIPDQTATAGTAFNYQFPENTFADADTGDTLTYEATKGDGTALPSWLTFTASSRTFSGTPTAAGTVSVKVTASDSTASVSDTFDIVVAAAP